MISSLPGKASRTLVDIARLASVYPLLGVTLHTSDYDVIFDFCVDSVSLAVQRHHDLIKATCREIGNVY